jgi:hypothetical protein
MLIRDKVNKLQSQFGFKRYNPEMVDINGFRFQIMFDTPAVRDSEEMDKLLTQATIEGFNIIMIFDSMEPQKNLLIEKILSNSMEVPPALISLFYDTQHEIFIQLSVDVKNGLVQLRKITK